ncbi:CpsD/CapB family tyrosine-protein kinase [Paraliobacillus sediminis]|uniref:CpsD/CapB family tyrosine-protein kinase n=1 Tax=Paraliobacillus sediminis TaxID=1885916 RepID=UPI000E3DF230|nr:CpsD/CapB family tyrosine-protein kinase [Paraliobacillus sediminis]
MPRKKQSSHQYTSLLARSNPMSVITEQYRTVRTNLEFTAVDRDIKTMLITSPGPGEGKTMTSANLAVVFAQQDKKVLIVDADMRKPSLHLRFRKNNQTGLSNILAGHMELKETVLESGVPHLDLITCGPIPPNPSELLGSKAMKELLTEAKEKYDFIIFDTPPALAVADSQVLANICDGALLVCRSKQTEAGGIQKTVELFEMAHAKILGIVLNGQEKKKSNHYQYMK